MRRKMTEMTNMRRKMTEMMKIGRKMVGTSKNVIKEEDGTREDNIMIRVHC